MARKKIALIGGGQIGGTLAHLAGLKGLGDVVIFDIADGLPQGKALDLAQSSTVEGYDARISGTADYSDIAGADVVIVTAGVARKPGMSRDDLISTNAGIVKTVVEQALKYSPDAIVIIVANPLDVMTYAAYKTAGVDSSKVFGMAGILDTARYRAFLATELDCSPNDIQALLMGGHGDTMVPLPRYTTVGGIPVTELLDNDKLEAIVQRTKVGGGELVKLMGTSAWYAPGAAAAQMCEAIVMDQNRVFPVCALLNGEYGQEGVYLGVPVKLGKNGIEEIVKVDLNEDEQTLLNESTVAVKGVMKVLDDMKLF